MILEKVRAALVDKWLRWKVNNKKEKRLTESEIKKAIVGKWLRWFCDDYWWGQIVDFRYVYRINDLKRENLGQVFLETRDKAQPHNYIFMKYDILQAIASNGWYYNTTGGQIEDYTLFEDNEQLRLNIEDSDNLLARLSTHRATIIVEDDIADEEKAEIYAEVPDKKLKWIYEFMEEIRQGAERIKEKLKPYEKYLNFLNDNDVVSEETPKHHLELHFRLPQADYVLTYSDDFTKCLTLTEGLLHSLYEGKKCKVTLGENETTIKVITKEEIQ